MSKYYTNMLKRRLRDGDVLLWLICVNVALYLAILITSLCSARAGVNLVGWLSLWADPAWLGHQPWTPLTYMFTQQSFLHILFNMLWLWWFGEVLLQTLSERHLLWIYITGGLAGAFGYLLPGLCGGNPFGSTVLMGSSAAVLCTMTVAAFRSPNLKFHLLLIGPVKLKWVALVSILLVFFGVGGGMSGAQSAHIGGVAWGAMLGLLYLNDYDVLARIMYPDRRFRAWRQKRALRKSAKAFRQAGENARRLDELLDKINVSGYDSLSAHEKAQLNTLSRRLKK